ncbi:hypothetical protein RFF05_11285 [Bengtsoniella intestinalis]|uniref:hypothetical protein n=1 Tax=Bengtsoniella intestinalis TaxID=3073143 RepID=UPI00391FBC0C
MAQNKEWTYRGQNRADIRSMCLEIERSGFYRMLMNRLANAPIAIDYQPTGPLNFSHWFYTVAIEKNSNLQIGTRDILNRDLSVFQRRFIEKTSVFTNIVPFAITSLSDDICKKDLRISFYVELQSTPYDRMLDRSWVIETDTSGRIKQHLCAHRAHRRPSFPFESMPFYTPTAMPPDKQLRLPIAFRPYLRYMATILNDDLFVDGWKGGNTPQWYHNKGGSSYYMGLLDANTVPAQLSTQTLGTIDQLLHSEAKDAAYILLAYSALAVVRPLLSDYKPFSHQSGISNSIKALEKQIVLSLIPQEGNESHQSSLQALAALCCGVTKDAPVSPLGIYAPDLAKDTCVPKVSQQQYEKAVLSGNNVLWVRSTPLAKQVISFDILPIRLEATLDFSSMEPIFQPLFVGFSKQVELYIAKKSHPNLQSQTIKATEIVTDLFHTLFPKCNPGLTAEDDSKLRQNGYLVLSEAKLYVEHLWVYSKRFLTAQDKMYAQDRREGRYQPKSIAYYMRYADSIEQEQRAHERDLRIWKNVKDKCNKAKQELCELEFQSDAFDKQFKKHYKAAEEHFCKNLPPSLRPKAAILLAAFASMVQLCGLPPEYIPALYEAMARQWIPACQSPLQRVESYLSACISQERYARIRGIHCDDAHIKIWYHPEKKQFYVPADQYIAAFFPDMKPFPSRKDATQTLGDLLVKCNRARYTQEIRLRTDGKKTSIVIVDGNKLSDTFMKSPVVAQAIAMMEADKSPYRTPSNTM